MSTWRERIEEGTGSEFAAEWLLANYHYPILALLVGFGLWTRSALAEQFYRQGTVLYSGNDPYYHLRSVQYVTENWPATMPFDPWTNFAQGTSSAQFGTLFDQLIATVALLLGLGDPSEMLIREVLLYSPVVFGVLAFVPAYVIGRRLGGRFGGVLSVAILAFATGSLFQVSFVGTADHHVAEALFQALGVLGMMVAVSVAEREKPVFELLADREFATIRRTLGWSMLAGVAVASYLWVWPPGVLLLGILGVFFVLYLSAEFVRGRSPEHVAIAGAISMTTTGVLVLSTTHSLDVSATSRSLLQPGLAFAVAVGCAFIAWLAREWESRDLPAVAFPAAILGIGVALTGLVAVVLPGLFGYLLNNVLRVVGFGYGTGAAAATVGEITPMAFGELYTSYGLAVLGAAAAIALVAGRQFWDDEPHGQEVLVCVWLIIVLMAALTQGRFAYYLTIPIATLNALIAGVVVGSVAPSGADDGIQTYQILTILAIVVVVLAPLTVFGATAADRGTDPRYKSPGFVQGWQPSFEWLQDNTPEPGQYANPDGEPMEYLGTFDRTPDYDYEDGAYGVLSWWDYGHWITAQGHRIPNANPFQQGSTHAARFLHAENESAALDELQDRDEDDAHTRYVMVDWQMADLGSKGAAPIDFLENKSRSDVFSYLVDETRLENTGNFNQAIVGTRHKQAYYDSMVNRLYHYHGSAMEPQPVVLQWRGAERELQGGSTYVTIPSASQNGTQPVVQFDSMQEAREFVEESPSTRQIGGVGTAPTERVPALEHFRLVHASPISGAQGGYSQTLAQTSPTGPEWTKTFERVPGGTIEGTGPANTTVSTSVTMETAHGSAFQYTQRARTDESGAFSMTVPYATTGYDEYGVSAGYTNTSVRANGTYELATGPVVGEDGVSQYTGSVDVTEGQVLGEDDSAATVDLEPQPIETEPADNVTIDGGGEGGGGGDGSVGDSGDGSDGDGGSDGAAESIGTPGDRGGPALLDTPTATATSRSAP